MCLQKKAITSDELMDIVTEEYDRITLQDGGKLKGKAAASDDAAFGADTSKNRKGQQKKFKFTGTCHNCGWTGHTVRVAIAGKRVVERLDKHQRDGNRAERNPRTPKIQKIQKVLPRRILWINWIAHG